MAMTLNVRQHLSCSCSNGSIRYSLALTKIIDEPRRGRSYREASELAILLPISGINGGNEDTVNAVDLFRLQSRPLECPRNLSIHVAGVKEPRIHCVVRQ